MKKVLVLGATGSIGTNAIEIIKNLNQDFTLCGVQAHNSKDKLNTIANQFKCPSLLTCENNTEEAFNDFILKTQPDIIVNGIAGAAGLMPSKVALENKIPLALANKETIVMAGSLIKKLAKEKNTPIVPVDSEHSAIFNLVEKIGKENISKIVITASGGPFREYTTEQLSKVTLEQALKHPTWNMGPKITIDSSTLANKGLEVIEAAYLFDVTSEQIQVVVHPQSLVHSLVRTNDGMLYAQISDPDMKHPIYNALTWPNNVPTYLEPFELFDQTMTFFKPRTKDFPMLNYAFECVKIGNGATISFNAANEVAVHAFLNKQISYLSISKIVYEVLQSDWKTEITSFEQVFQLDSKAREIAMEALKKFD